MPAIHNLFVINGHVAFYADNVQQRALAGTLQYMLQINYRNDRCDDCRQG